MLDREPVPKIPDSRVCLPAIVLCAFVLACDCRKNQLDSMASSAHGGANPASSVNSAPGPRVIERGALAGQLNWGPFGNRPASRALNDAPVASDMDILLLVHAFTDGKFDPEEFAFFFPAFAEPKNESERRRLGEIIESQLTARAKELSHGWVVAKAPDVRVGAYDFQRKAYPIVKYLDRLIFADRSQDGEQEQRQLKLLLSRTVAIADAGPTTLLPLYFDNLRDKRQPERPLSVIRVQDNVAKRIECELGLKEDLNEKTEAYLQGRSYEGYHTAVAYFLFRPERAQNVTTRRAGVLTTTKELHGTAVLVVFATPLGTVLDVADLQQDSR
jgi:hypothetical protein